MSVRGLWIFSSLGTGNSGRVLFSRTFPTVEKRAKTIQGTKYIAIPDGDALLDAISKPAQFGNIPSEFNAERDGCKKHDTKPVHSVKISSGELWPLVIVEQQGLLFCCLPLVKQGVQARPEITEMPGLSSGYSLLIGMIEFLGPVPKGIDETYNRFGDLYLYVGEAAPFGTPVDTNPATVRLTLQGKYGAPKNKTEKLPTWRPIQFKGKSQIVLSIKERIRAAMFDRPDAQDTIDVYGSVSCKADIEGHLPEVSLDLKVADSTTGLLDNVTTHYCVQSVEPMTFSNRVPSSDELMPGCKLRFTPPTDVITLCNYSTSSVTEPPIHGFYQMKGEQQVDVLVQLKLSESVKNAFEYCEVQLPFHHRGTIVSHESSPNHGSVLLSPDKKTVVWNIGQKFPTRTLEVILKSSITFEKYEPPLPETGTTEEMFCIGHNSFAQLFFKLDAFTISGITVDSKSIQITPTTKFKHSIDMELVSGDYRIWNSHGDVPSAFTPTAQLLSDLQGL